MIMTTHISATLQFARKSRWTRVAALGLAVLTCGVAGAAQAADTFDLLRKGGYTLFFRHTQSDWAIARAPAPAKSGAATGATSGVIAKVEACAGEPQLSEEGRADARALGMAIKSLKLSVSDISSANLCRMRETATIAFGAPRTVADLAPRPGYALSLSAQAAAVERLAGAPLAEHSLRVIVGDYEVAQALYGVTLAEGDAVVLKTGADGRQSAVAHLRLGEWRAVALAKAAFERIFHVQCTSGFRPP